MIEYGMQLKGDFPREIPGEIPRETPNHNLIRIGNNIHGSHTHTHTRHAGLTIAAWWIITKVAIWQIIWSSDRLLKSLSMLKLIILY